ncbi:dynein associated protein-domain-containing protein [Blastocladiella britannica]|nr:dynein associated protein-domain-containing protein [Blastocladiella britannica]
MASAPLALGTRVSTSSGDGVVRYFGTTHFSTGQWVGVELDTPTGKNDGIVQGQVYFQCAPNHGLFLRPSQARPVGAPLSSNNSSSSSSLPQQDPPSRPQSRVDLRSPPTGTSPAASRRSSTRPTSTIGGGNASSSVTSPPVTKRMSMIAASQLAAMSSGSSSSSSRPLSLSRPGTPSSAAAAATGSAPPTPTAERPPVAGAMEAPYQQQLEQEQQPPMPPTPSLSEAKISALRDLVSSVASSAAARGATPVSAAAPAAGALSSGILPMTPVAAPSFTPAPEAVPVPALVVPRRISDAAAAPSVVPEPPTATRAVPLPVPTPVQAAIPASTTAATRRSSQTITSPTFAPATPAAPPGPTQHDYDELRAKVRYLESKRGDDLAKIRALEALQDDAHAVLGERDRLQARLATMQAEAREARKAAHDAEVARDDAEARLADAQDALEMVTLDKELAEEKCEGVERELEAVRDRVEELELDLQVEREERALRAEGAYSAADDADVDQDGTAGAAAAAAPPPVEVTQLLRQTERLKDALGMLKEQRDEMEADLSTRIKQLEMEAAHGADAKDALSVTREQLAVADDMINELKAALEDAESADAVVEKLNDKNLALNDRLIEFQLYIDDLESMRVLSEETEANLTEMVNELTRDIDVRDSRIRGLEDAMGRTTEVLADYEHTIGQFRDRTKQLAAENEELRAIAGPTSATAGGGTGSRAIVGLLGATHGSAATDSASQEVLALHHKLATHAMKVQAKTIDLELKQLEAMQAAENLALVQAYLPEAFFSTEEEPMAALLLVRRLAFKADVLHRHSGASSAVGESNAVDAEEGSNASAIDDDAAAMALAHELAWMHRVAAALAAFMEACSGDTFGGPVARTYAELASAEKRLDTALAALRSDGSLRARTVAPELARINRQLDATLANLSGLGAAAALESSTSVATGPDGNTNDKPLPPTAAAHVVRLSQLVEVQGAEDAASRLAMALLAMTQASVRALDGVSEPMSLQVGSVRSTARKLARILADAKAGLVADAATVHSVLANVRLVADYMRDVAQDIGVMAVAAVPAANEYDEDDQENPNQTAGGRGSSVVATHDEALAIVQTQTLRHFDCTEPRPFATALDVLKRAAMDLAVVYEACSAKTGRAEPIDPVALAAGVGNGGGGAPWIARADAMRAVAEAHASSSPHQVAARGGAAASESGVAAVAAAEAQAQARLVRALTELRARDEEVRELMVRCQLLESRTAARESANMNAAILDEVMHERDVLRTEVGELNRFIDHLREENKLVDDERREMERKYTETVRAISSSNGSGTSSANGSGGGGNSPIVGGGGAINHGSGMGANTPRGGATGSSAGANTIASAVPVLVAALAHVRAENARLKAAKLLAQLDQCPALPALPSLDTLQPVPAGEVDDDEEGRPMAAARGAEALLPTSLREVAVETRAALRQARLLAAAPRMVSVVTSAAPNAHRWVSQEKRAAMQQQRERIQARMVARKAVQLETYAARYLTSARSATSSGSSGGAAASRLSNNGPVPSVAARRLGGRRGSTSSMVSFMTSATHAAAERAPVRLATVRIPAVASVVSLSQQPKGRVVSCYVTSPAELELIHGSFVN